LGGSRKPNNRGYINSPETVWGDPERPKLAI